MASRRQLLGGGIGAAAILGGVMAKAGLSGARPVADIAAAGFIYGLPIVMSYAVLYALAIDTGSGQYRGPFNALKSDAAVLTYKDTAVVTPNSDTPYGFAALDLRAEPMVISVPAVARERYYAVQLCDGNTYNFGYIGTRATGVEAGDYLVAGPEWAGAVAAGIKGVFRSSTQFAVAIFRTQLFGVGDVGGVRAVQAGYRVQALSGFTGLGAPPAAPAVAFPKISKELIRTHFFAYLDFALRFAPAAANEMAMRAQLAQIGVGPGAAVRFADLSVTERLEVLVGNDGERMACRCAVRRCGAYQRRLADAGGGGAGGDLWQLRRGGSVSAYAPGQRGAGAGWQTRRVYADVCGGSVASGGCILVGDAVRRGNPVADQEPD